MVKIVLDTQQIKKLQGLVPGQHVRLDILGIVESTQEMEAGYEQVTLDVKGCLVSEVDG